MRELPSGAFAASATDIAGFLECPHLTTLDRAAASGELTRPIYADAAADLLAKRGNEHEREVLDTLRQEVGAIVEIADGAREEQIAKTLAALRAGSPVVYQASLANGIWVGRADFLMRVGRPSRLGAWSYEVIDAKLAREAKAWAIVQLCLYSELVSVVQGTRPELMHLALGGSAGRLSFRVATYIPYFRRVRDGFVAALTSTGPPATYPEPVEHCEVCDWSSMCRQRWREDDHLSLVAGVTRSQRKALRTRDIVTVASLGSLQLPLSPPLERVGRMALQRIRDQAAIQVRGREQRRILHELLPMEPERGLGMLPPPSAGDLFLDLEGDPYTLGEGLEYLFGLVEIVGEDPNYTCFWAHDLVEERAAFERLIDLMMARLAKAPDLHIYHYNHYEPTALKRLAGRFSTRVDEVDRLLRGRIFVDLYRAVRQSLRASVESYSIKKLEPLYGFERSGDLREASRCLEAFVLLLELGGGDSADEARLKATIEAYNRDDCVSAWRLREWLESERRRVETSMGVPVPRPGIWKAEPTEELSEAQARVRALMCRLLDDSLANEAERARDPERQARWLLAQMLEWHRREDKSEWWEYYRLCDLTDAELQEDKSALGGLEYVGAVTKIKKSVVHRYRFPPQEHAIDRALEVRDPATGGNPGTVLLIDEDTRSIDLKRGASSSVPHPTALVPYNIVKTKELQASLERLALAVLEGRVLAQGQNRAARDLLLPNTPRLRDGQVLRSADESAEDAARRLALVLDETVLPIQGPPGTGKTFTAAGMIVELVEAGRKVGITANSHKVITNLLKRVSKVARDKKLTFRAIQKVSESDDECADPWVTCSRDNAEVCRALADGDCLIGAGTAWLWSRDEMAGSVDVLFVDEAGQMSLANTLAIAQAGASLVLIGDPQQLDQPQQGIHPPGAEVSVLAHLVGPTATMGPWQGLFLDETYRLHPDVCGFISETFYDDKLEPRPTNRVQRINVEGPLDGTGLRFLPVRHSGNQNESDEEAQAVADLVGKTLRSGATWTDWKGTKAPLTAAEILVVAPYNAHVAALRRRLPVGVQVGTVDKFQGQEAPIVIYSMATSSPEDAPRGMEFLYSGHRLNVAISRARCVAVLVANPGLFQVRCRTPRQMELASAFCRYLEIATTVI